MTEPAKETRRVKLVKWGNRIFLLSKEIEITISQDLSPPYWITARHIQYPPISGNGRTHKLAWDRWRQDLAESYDQAVEGVIQGNRAEAILQLIKAEAIEHEPPKRR